MEHWLEINLEAELETQDGILLDSLRPFVRRLEKSGELLTWHYFREPEIRFRARVKSRASLTKQKASLTRLADSLVRRRLVTGWHFGNHGEEGVEYTGEEDRYGRNGWKVAQDYFRNGSETALALLDLKRRSRLENPLWGKGLGNPWEGGDLNPWKEKVTDPLGYHWSRFVHLFTNQLGFDMAIEAGLCARQSEKYRLVMKRSGMKW